VTARKEHASGAFRLQAGGTLSPRRHVYIERREDKEALHLLLAGEYVNILSSRQMGKSSLMVRIKRELNARGVRVATVDLASDVGAPPQPDSFYLTLLKSIADELELNVVFGDWWRERSSDTVNRRFLDFFQTIALSRVDGPVVVFLDEIDSTLRLLYTDDLFTAIRGVYNRRATTTAFERLTFCLVGVATPNELIKDARTTPYNVGATIELRDFDASRDDLNALAVHLDPDPETGLVLLDRVLHWTDGHPYMTVKLCAELAATVAKTGKDVDRYVEAAFTSLDRLGGEPHFLQILRFLKTRLANSLATLSLYRRIISGRREPDQQTMAHAQLKLSGLVKRDNVGRLIVRNEIYRRLFDAKWAAAEISALQGHVDLAAMRVLVSSIDGEAGLRVEFPRRASQADFNVAIASLVDVDHLSELSLTNTEITDIASLAGLTALQTLYLLGTAVADIYPLAGLTTLRTLSLSGTQVSDIAPLTGLTALQSLSLSATKVKYITPLARLNALKTLYLSKTQVADIGPLAGLTTLQTLDLSATRVADVVALSRLTALLTMDLSGTQVADIAALARLTSLQRLNLSATQVANCAALAGLPALQSLDVSGTPVDDIAALADLTALRSLDLSGTQVADITALAGLTALQSLDLSGTQVADITALAGLTALRSLDLSGTQVADITALAGLTALQSLDLSGTQVADIAPLADVTALQSLDLSGTQVADIAPLSELIGIQKLDLTGTRVPVSQATKLISPFVSRDIGKGVTSLARSVDEEAIDIRRI
jgi:internalin A